MTFDERSKAIARKMRSLARRGKEQGKVLTRSQLERKAKYLVDYYQGRG